MLGKTRGIVLHSLKQGESGLITKIYTEDNGLLAFFLRSTYSKKKGSATALYQPLTKLDLVLDVRESKTLHAIRSAQLSEAPPTFIFQPVKACIGLFMAEVFMNSIEEEEGSPELFAFLWKWISYLDQANQTADIPVSFMLSLSMPLGFYPHMESKGEFFDLREGYFLDRIPDHQDYLEGDICAGLRGYHGTGFVAEGIPVKSKELRRNILEALIRYFRVHIPQFRELKSYQVLTEIFKT